MFQKENCLSENTMQTENSASAEDINRIIADMRTTVETIAMKYIASPLEKDDLVQEGLIGLLAAIRSYNDERGASFKTYAAICIENSIQTALRKFNRQKDVPKENVIPYEEYIKTQSSAISAEDTYLAAESVSALTDFLEKELSPLENEVLRLHIIGCSYSEIAQKLHKTQKAVDNALQRIRRKLYDTSF